MGRLSPALAIVAVLAGLALAACDREPPPEPPAPPPAAERRPTLMDRFDPSDVVFEPVRPEEPSEAVVQIPPRPPPPSPAPRLLPVPAPPAPARGPSGRCDVRATEGFCFAFTGDGWTPAAARAQCDAAPDAAFGAAACPLADRIATCAFERPSAPGREIVYTYYAPYDPSLAELACPGTFTRLD